MSNLIVFIYLISVLLSTQDTYRPTTSGNIMVGGSTRWKRSTIHRLLGDLTN